MRDDKPISIEDFLKDARETGLEATWVITIDPNRPDYILYYPHISSRQRCPYVPIHKDRVLRIQRLRQVRCYLPSNPSFPARAAWIARVVLKPLDRDEDAELLNAITAIEELAQLATTAGRDFTSEGPVDECHCTENDSTAAWPPPCSSDPNYYHLYWRVRFGDDWKRDSRHRTSNSWRRRRDQIVRCGYETANIWADCPAVDRRAPCPRTSSEVNPSDLE